MKNQKLKTTILAIALSASLCGSAIAQDMPGMKMGTNNAATAKVVETDQITISNFTFDPENIKVHVGTKVTWTNKDDTAHRVMIKDLKVKSEALDTGDSFSYTFDKAGTYPYFCTMHPVMTGSITV